jgi:hypothetical protein
MTSSADVRCAPGRECFQAPPRPRPSRLKALDPDVVREGLPRSASGRLTRTPLAGGRTRRAHNPHGARAAAAGITEAFAFAPLDGAAAVMATRMHAAFSKSSKRS